MKIGEIREIYIHPSLGYGIYTTLEKGIYLKAMVQLVKILKVPSKENWPAPVYMDFSKEMNPSIKQNCEEMAQKVGYVTGYKVWQHYKLSQLYSLSIIQEWIRQFQNGLELDISSDEKQNVINKLHWNLYHTYPSYRGNSI